MKLCKISRQPLSDITAKFPRGRFSIFSEKLRVMGHDIINVDIKPYPVRNPYLAYGLGIAVALFRFRKIKADLLLADFLESGVIALLLKKISHIPFVFDFIDDYSLIASYDGRILRHHFLKNFEKLIPRFADSVIVVSQEMRDFCLQLGVQGEKVEVIPNGVDIDLFTPGIKPDDLKSRYSLQRNRVVFFRGKMNRYYRLDQILNAVPTVLKAFPETKFLMVGDGKNLKDLKSLAKDLEIDDSVVFTGMVPLSELPRHINLADICLYPLPNSTALAVLEYAACCKPIILPRGGTKKIGNSHELVRKNCVLLVDDSPEGFAKGICMLLEDEQLRKELGEKAMNIAVNKYTWDKIAEQYDQVLKKACS